MVTMEEISEFLHQIAPLDLAESWDNVGLLVGRSDQTIAKGMTCLTLTPESVAEAVRERADLIVVHHPLPFRPIQRINDTTPVGRLLLSPD